jgi:hypothetical protein
MAEQEIITREEFHCILAFIPDDSDFTLEGACDRLREAFPRRAVRVGPEGRGKGVEIAAKQWRVWLSLVQEPHVAEESREMAEWLADHPRSKEIAGCKRRIEFGGTDIQTGSRCHAAMFRACCVLKQFRGVVIFDLELRDTVC